MLRFNLSIPSTFNIKILFQYILCYGSTFQSIFGICTALYFNTSYVTVQLASIDALGALFCHFNTSYVTVQQFLRGCLFWTRFNFNTSYVTVQQRQYHSCGCSHGNFNTSYVTVQRGYLKTVHNKLNYFNTSYVTVQQIQAGKRCGTGQNFNTSYVTVQHIKAISISKEHLHFNTSYVTVQRVGMNLRLAPEKKFQYILCYGSTLTSLRSINFLNEISIHLMLRFNLGTMYHPLHGAVISIHLMLRFNGQRRYGFAQPHFHFNTSYVTVQQIYVFIIGTYKCISIHLMLRFNPELAPRPWSNLEFQYILCYGSTTTFGAFYFTVYISIHLMLRFNIPQISQSSKL